MPGDTEFSTNSLTDLNFFHVQQTNLGYNLAFHEDLLNRGMNGCMDADILSL
jgi:hypothetical protein